MTTQATESQDMRWTTLPPGTATRGELLRSFERLRREISVSVQGNEGMFAGFDRLTFFAAEDVPEAPVLVQVSVARRLEGSHCVDFVALAFEPERSHRTLGRGGVVVVAQGHGRTMTLG